MIPTIEGGYCEPFPKPAGKGILHYGIAADNPPIVQAENQMTGKKKIITDHAQEPDRFLDGKSEYTLELYNHFITAFAKVGPVTIHPAKTMIGIANDHKRIAYITQLGKNFIHVVFPFAQPYEDNLCFQKIAQVPGDARQFNHHLRIVHKEDVNAEVIKFMKLAWGN